MEVTLFRTMPTRCIRALDRICGGRPAVVQWGGANCPVINFNPTPNGSTFSQMYSYTAAGLMIKKRLRVTRNISNGSTATGNLDGTYTYDNEGKMTSVQYPVYAGGPAYGAIYTYSFDSMGRPNGLVDNQPSPVTWVQNATYGPAGEMTQIVYGLYGGSESRQYNSRLQLTRLTAPGIDLQYSYAAAPNNNGKLAQMTDAVSGETVTYTYDALSRLLTANSSLGAGYNQSYVYDGFGNLSSKNGGQTGWGVDPAKNRAIGLAYDNNGNAGSMPGIFTYAVYDVENRMASVNPLAGGTETYAYGVDNKRVWKLRTDGVEEIYLYGAMGEKLGTYGVASWSFSGGGFVLNFGQMNTNLYFAGKLIQSQGSFVSVDRLGSVRRWGGYAQSKYYPYGEEYTTTQQDREKFATYYRDGNTGLDYADQRYYASTQGRFLTADPFRHSASLSNPGSWNRYTYAANDPVNSNDPSGLYPCGSSSGQSGGVISVTVYDCPDRTYLTFRPVARPVPYMTLAQWDDIHPDPNPLHQKIHICGDFFCGADGSLLGPIPASYMNADDPLANLLLFKGTTTVAGLLNGAFGTTFTAGEEIVAGLYGNTTRAALTAAAADTGATTTVLTNLSDAPALGRALSVATGHSAAALAGQATAGAAGTLYTANIPNALIQQLISIGAAFQYTTHMNGVVGTEIRFTAQASEYLINFFKPLP